MMYKRKKILVMTYAVSPYKGSEYSVAWNYITHMSQYHDLTVLYGMSDNHMGDNETMSKWLAKNELQNVRFVFVTPSKLANSLNWCNRHDILVYTFYFAFQIWQKCAYKKAKELLQSEHFDLIHNVGPIGYREPGYLWKLGLPYVWGPIGGANNSPWVLVKHLPFKSKLKHIFRTLANSLQIRYSYRLKKALRDTDILLTSTTENQRVFKEKYGKDSIYIPENCINSAIHVNETKYDCPETYNFIIVGRQDDRKNSILFLRSLTSVKQKTRIHVDIVGNGPSIPAMQQYASDNGLSDIIDWHGQLPHAEAVKLFNNAHLHIITSISEGNPTTIWEAMSYGVPTLSLNHCGMHDTIDNKSGILIPIHSYEQCVRDIAIAIDNLLTHPERFEMLSEGVVKRSKMYTWNIRCEFWNDIYEKITSRCYL